MLAPGDALGSPESGPRACCLALRAGLASSDPRTRPGRGLGIHHEALCPPGLHSCLLPLLCGPQVQRMNVPRWGQRLGGPLGWADVPTYVSAASPRLPPRSRPLPPLAPPGLSGALQASGCVGPGRPRRGTWVSAASARLSVINPASASHLSGLCGHSRPTLGSAPSPRPCRFMPVRALSCHGVRGPPRRPPRRRPRQPLAPLRLLVLLAV